MQSLKQLSMLVLVCFLTANCSAFRSSTEIVSVTTDHPDSMIYVNGGMVGQGSTSASVKRNQNVQIMVKKDGYVTQQRTIGKSLNVTGILDIIGGVLVLLPIFGLLAPGAYSLDENNVTVLMVKQ